MVDINSLMELQTQSNAILLGMSKKLDVASVGFNIVQSPFLVYDIYSRSHQSDIVYIYISIINELCRELQIPR